MKREADALDAPGVSAVQVPTPLSPLLPRKRRYTLTPARLRWDHFNLTYRCDLALGWGFGHSLTPIPDLDPHPRILSFPRNLLSPRETRQGLAAAFRMWSDVSPFSFREVAPGQPSDLRIGGCCDPAPAQPSGLYLSPPPPTGFYPANHTDCLVSALHHCFDGPTGELAHAFFPPHGGIHFDDSEHWVLGPTRYSWKKGAPPPEGLTVTPGWLHGEGFGAEQGFPGVWRVLFFGA